MKKQPIRPFFAGVLTALLCFGIVSSALAASGQVTFNAVNVTVNGEAVCYKGDYMELESGEKVPSSILYVDETGGGTTYLPVASLAKALEVRCDWIPEVKTVMLGNGEHLMIDPDVYTKVLANQWLVDGKYPVNEKGETYGPETLSDVVGTPPDLIQAVATNGAEGYIRYDDMYGFLREEDGVQPEIIPVYDLDGNQIGEFKIGG